MPTPESKIKKEINKILEKHGCYRFMPVPGQFGKKTVDYLVCCNGRFIAVEAKAPGKQPTPLQHITMQEIHAAGGIALVVDGPEGLTVLERLLNEHRPSIPAPQSYRSAA